MFQNCVARALYDNIAESPDELAFRKGDTLTVLEQNTGGIEGWWLCSLRGRQVRRPLLYVCLCESLCFAFAVSLCWFFPVPLIMFPQLYLSSSFSF
jgi:hypothetical protein